MTWPCVVQWISRQRWCRRTGRCFAPCPNMHALSRGCRGPSISSNHRSIYYVVLENTTLIFISMWPKFAKFAKGCLSKKETSRMFRLNPELIRTHVPFQIWTTIYQERGSQIESHWPFKKGPQNSNIMVLGDDSYLLINSLLFCASCFLFPAASAKDYFIWSLRLGAVLL